MLTVGIDIGSSSVKVALLRHEEGSADGPPAIAHLVVERYRRRSPGNVVRHALDQVFDACGKAYEDMAYVATTGEGDLAPRRDGHFYGMTTHAKGALFLEPSARSVLDGGALHARAIRIDPRGRVMSYRMTSQCASGSGQFIENIARYLGVPLEDVGPTSLRSERSEGVSSICAVLAETDVINMVARGVPAPAILRGIHGSVAGRLAKLMRLCRVESPVCVTGGLAADVGLLDALRRQLEADGQPMEVLAPANALHAGAIGAAIWGAYRARQRGGAPRKEEVRHVAA